MNTLKIEKGIPLPENHWKSAGIVELVRKLKVGESIQFDSYAKANHYGKVLGKGNYITRKGRLWRTK